MPVLSVNLTMIYGAPRCVFLTNEFSGTEWNHSKKSLLPKSIAPKAILSSWEKNVISWTKNSWDCPKMIMRYEDLVYDKKI